MSDNPLFFRHYISGWFVNNQNIQCPASRIFPMLFFLLYCLCFILSGSGWCCELAWEPEHGSRHWPEGDVPQRLARRSIWHSNIRRRFYLGLPGKQMRAVGAALLLASWALVLGVVVCQEVVSLSVQRRRPLLEFLPQSYELFQWKFFSPFIQQLYSCILWGGPLNWNPFQDKDSAPMVAHLPKESMLYCSCRCRCRCRCCFISVSFPARQIKTILLCLVFTLSLPDLWR